MTVPRPGTVMRSRFFQPPGTGPFAAAPLAIGADLHGGELRAPRPAPTQSAARLSLAILAPDTSPRGDAVANDPAYDLGQGASFYVDATQAPWAAALPMERYVTEDLPAAWSPAFPVDAARRGIAGHSMGGHGALTLALRHPQLLSLGIGIRADRLPDTLPLGPKGVGSVPGRSDQELWRAHDAT